MPHGPVRHQNLVSGRHPERPWLLICFGAIGLLGCASLIVGTVVATVVVPGHDWIADTISDLAAGRFEIIMDFALYGFAAGLMSTALAASHAHLGAGGWSVGIVSFAVLAALVTVIAARNEYGDKDNEGIVIHMYLVYALGALFLLTCATMQTGLRASGHGMAGAALIGLGPVWAIISGIFLMSPTSVDGLIERVLGLVACAVVVVLSTVFMARGRALIRKR